MQIILQICLKITEFLLNKTDAAEHVKSALTGGDKFSTSVQCTTQNNTRTKPLKVSFSDCLSGQWFSFLLKITKPKIDKSFANHGFVILSMNYFITSCFFSVISVRFYLLALKIS